jgi:hypothetical protein
MSKRTGPDAQRFKNAIEKRRVSNADPASSRRRRAQILLVLLDTFSLASDG